MRLCSLQELKRQLQGLLGGGGLSLNRFESCIAALIVPTSPCLAALCICVMIVGVTFSDCHTVTATNLHTLVSLGRRSAKAKAAAPIEQQPPWVHMNGTKRVATELKMLTQEVSWAVTCHRVGAAISRQQLGSQPGHASVNSGSA